MYDRLGRALDTQAFYEDPAHRALAQAAYLAQAHRVFEFGCGTGRLAVRMLAEHLPPDACYRGVDISPRMVALARGRLAPWADRASVELADGSPPTRERYGSCDRFVSTFVLDLLPRAAILELLDAAACMLEPGGLLCTANLTLGRAPLARAVTGAWQAANRLAPALLGGCRPIRLEPLLRERGWAIVHHESVHPFGFASEVTVGCHPQERTGT